jgi:hypothetical protein
MEPDTTYKVHAGRDQEAHSHVRTEMNDFFMIRETIGKDQAKINRNG